MEGLAVPFNAIKEGLATISNALSYINPFSDNFILKDFFTNFISWFNPFSDNFILKNIINFLGSILNYLNPFSEDFILLKLWNFLVEIISYINPFSENFFVYKLIDLLGDLLKWLFVPNNNPFNELSNKFDEKFAFVNQIKTLVNDLLGYTNYGDKAPSFDMTWHGVTFSLIDFSLFLNYRTWLHGIILAIAWFVFIFKTYKKLPSIIGGFSQ